MTHIQYVYLCTFNALFNPADFCRPICRTALCRWDLSSTNRQVWTARYACKVRWRGAATNLTIDWDTKFGTHDSLEHFVFELLRAVVIRSKPYQRLRSRKSNVGWLSTRTASSHFVDIHQMVLLRCRGSVHGVNIMACTSTNGSWMCLSVRMRSLPVVHFTPSVEWKRKLSAMQPDIRKCRLFITKISNQASCTSHTCAPRLFDVSERTLDYKDYEQVKCSLYLLRLKWSYCNTVLLAFFAMYIFNKHISVYLREIHRNDTISGMFNGDNLNV